MSIYKTYIDVVLLRAKLKKKIDNNPSRIADIYRRAISIAINSLHQIAKKKSVGGYALAILETKINDLQGGDLKVQSTIRIFSKKLTSLEHIRSVILNMRFFNDFFDIGLPKNVNVQASNYYAFVRIRLPTKIKQPATVEIKKEILSHASDCNFIYLMPSSSIKGNKRLIRYYYKIVPVDYMKPAQFSRPDGYGFSRTNRICALPNL